MKRSKRLPLKALASLAIFVMGTLGLTAYTLWLMRGDAIKNGFEVSALLSQSFEDHLTQSIHLTELAGVNAVPVGAGLLNLRQIEHDFSSILRNSPYLRSISLLDDANRVIASSNKANIGLSMATTDYFPVTNGSQSVLRIGSPWAGRDFAGGRESNHQSPVDTPESFIPITQTLISGGRLLTLLVALNPDHFLQRMTMQFQHKAGSVAVLRLDGTLLMDTDSNSLPGTMHTYPGPSFHFNDVESGQFELDRHDGTQALAAYIVSSLYPFAVVTQLEREHVLLNWRYEAKTLLGIVGPTLLVLMWLAVAFYRRQLLLEAQRAKSQRLQQVNAAKVFSNSQEGILIASSDGSIIDVNDAFVHITGYSREEVLGKNPRLLSSGRHDKSFFAEMWHQLHDHGVWRGEIWNRRKDGEAYVEEITISAVRDDVGTARQYVGQFSDISMRKQIEERVNQLAFFDPLTRLPNRRLFTDRLSQFMLASKRSGLYGAVMFLDLDNFKPLNDLHGHGAGDLLLAEVANRLTACVREIDTVARFGGDEFVVLLAELNLDRERATRQARNIADKISASVAAPYHLATPVQGVPGTTINHQCSASIGVVIFLADEESHTDLLERADTAMYKAKQAGKNTVWLFTQPNRAE